MSLNPPRWAELNDDQRELVNRYIDTLLAEQAPLPIDKPGREVVERRTIGSISYQHEKIKCGKATCRCAKGELHGPYWYAYYRRGKKVVSKYIGKELKQLAS